MLHLARGRSLCCPAIFAIHPVPQLSSLRRISRYASSLPKVLLLDEITLAHEDLNQLKGIAAVTSLTSKDRASFLQACKTEYSDITAFYRHFKGSASVRITGVFDDELVSQLPSSLRFICHNGAGYDQISIPACSARSIQVSNVPTAVDDATADTALFLIIGVLRQFKPALLSATAGAFNSNLPLSNDPKGKLLGILGMGGIGRALAKRARALGMQIQYHNRNRLSPDLEHGARYVSASEIISTSDVISLNLPLNPSTKHLISTAAFKQMKRSAILVNTARGSIVDQTALINALNDGDIAGTGLDVYENEPDIPRELLNHPRAFCLPHIGTLTVETQRAMEAFCLQNIIHGIQTGHLRTVVPEQK